VLGPAGLPALAAGAGRRVSGLGLDPGLERRLRTAGAAIVWRTATAGPRGRSRVSARVARLAEEEARVEVRESAAAATVEVAAGPVGAVVLLLEADRRGAPSSLGSRNGRPRSPFPLGSIVAAWGGPPVAADARPTVRDLVELARYALP
jgi:hypothetical protein